MERVPMTQEAYARIRAEVDELENVTMPQIASDVALARDEGDLKENAEYHAQKEKQGMVQAKINQLRGKLSLAQIVDPAAIPRDRVAFGASRNGLGRGHRRRRSHHAGWRWRRRLRQRQVLSH